jgi:hypothetical protein
MIRQCPPAGVLAALALTALLAGCGRGTGNVSGTVKYNGQVLTAGTITFYDPDNRASSSPIKPDGSYAVRDVRTGRAKIAIAVPLPISFAGPSIPGAEDKKAHPAVQLPSIPAKYLDADQSGLTFEVRRGEQTHNIDLAPP